MPKTVPAHDENKITPERLVSWLSRSMPNAEQIEWLDLQNVNEIRFEWRGSVFRVTTRSIFVEEVEGSMLTGSDKAALIEQLIKKQWQIEQATKR